MAVLTGAQLDQLRQACFADLSGKGGKPAQNAALQAIEDYFETVTRPGLGTAVNTATVIPFGVTYSVAEKTALVKWWLKQKFERGG